MLEGSDTTGKPLQSWGGGGAILFYRASWVVQIHYELAKTICWHKDNAQHEWHKGAHRGVLSNPSSWWRLLWPALGHTKYIKNILRRQHTHPEESKEGSAWDADNHKPVLHPFPQPPRTKRPDHEQDFHSLVRRMHPQQVKLRLPFESCGRDGLPITVAGPRMLLTPSWSVLLHPPKALLQV